MRVITMHRGGLSFMQIAIALNARSVPTPTGRPRWSKQGVSNLLHTRHVREIEQGMYG